MSNLLLLQLFPLMKSWRINEISAYFLFLYISPSSIPFFLSFFLSISVSVEVFALHFVPLHFFPSINENWVLIFSHPLRFSFDDTQPVALLSTLLCEMKGIFACKTGTEPGQRENTINIKKDSFKTNGVATYAHWYTHRHAHNSTI